MRATYVYDASATSATIDQTTVRTRVGQRLMFAESLLKLEQDITELV